MVTLQVPAYCSEQIAISNFVVVWLTQGFDHNEC